MVRMSRYIDLTGNRFGDLLVLGRSDMSGVNGEVIFSCQCNCGNITEVFSTNLRRGFTNSCGCVRNKITSERMSKQSWGRKYKFNERFFEKVNSESVAYWLGFLGADGNVYKNSLQVSLGSKDVEHLYKFMESIGTDSPPVYRTESDTYQLKVNSKAMVADLLHLGITPRKSLCYVPPSTELLGDFSIDYWRGMIDGDGWIIKSSKNQMVVGICGTWETCVEFRNFLNSKGIDTKASPNINVDGVNNFSVSVGGNKIVPKICKLLYGNCSIYLERKFKKAMEFISND